MANEHDWITLHRVRFAKKINGVGNPLPGPQKADVWRFAPEGLPLDTDGNRDRANDAWGGLALFSNKKDAEAVFENPGGHLPMMDDVIEEWHALVIPYAHHGSVNWRGTVETNSAIRIAADVPKGPLVVVTTAGYADPSTINQARVLEFMRGIDEVLEFYGSLPGNLRRGLYSGVEVDGTDGITMTLWKDDQSMMAGAYRPGAHKSQLDSHRASPMFDRSSFSRGRIQASKGTWGGSNPMDEIPG